MAESNLENLLVATSFLFIVLTTMVATRTSRLSMARTPRHSMARSQVVERVMATDSWQILCGSHFARFLHIRRLFFTDFACRHQRLSCTRRGVKTEHLVARTFFSVLCVSRAFEHLLTFSHALACGSRHDWDVLHICAPQKSSTLTACFIDILFHVTSVVTELTACDWNQETPPPFLPYAAVLLRQEDCCLAIWLNQPLTPQMGPGATPASQKSSIMGLMGSDFFERPASGRKHCLNMWGATLKKLAFPCALFLRQETN